MLVMVSNELCKKIDFILGDVVLLKNETLTKDEQEEFDELQRIIRKNYQNRLEY